MTCQNEDFSVDQVVDFDALNFVQNPHAIAVIRLPFPIEFEINLNENRTGRRSTAVLRYPDNRMRHIPIVYLDDSIQQPAQAWFFYAYQSSVHQVVKIIFETPGLIMAEFEAVDDWRKSWLPLLLAHPPQFITIQGEIKP